VDSVPISSAQVVASTDSVLELHRQLSTVPRPKPRMGRVAASLNVTVQGE
jgi:hypothetical protein